MVAVMMRKVAALGVGGENLARGSKGVSRRQKFGLGRITRWCSCVWHWTRIIIAWIAIFGVLLALRGASRIRDTAAPLIVTQGHTPPTKYNALSSLDLRCGS